jgi:hypothetical protein
MNNNAPRCGNFVTFESPDGYTDYCDVNLDHVRKYEYLKDGQCKVWWSNGDVEVLPVMGRIAPEKYFVVPAQPGFELLTYYAPEGGEEFPIQRTPVIAWRIEEYQTADRNSDENPIAISTTGTSVEDNTGVRSPSGQVTIHRDGRQFENEEKWLEWAKEAVRQREEEWKRKRTAAE